jgi:hypothetical protein
MPLDFEPEGLLDLPRGHLLFRALPHPRDQLVEEVNVLAEDFRKFEIGTLRRRRHANDQFFQVHGRRSRQLHRIAEIDRNRKRARAFGDDWRERQQISHAPDDHCDRVNVHSGDVVGCLFGPKLFFQARLFGLFDEIADGMKQESARAACRIEHPLLDRPLDRMAHDFRCQPVRRVVFAQPVALVPVDRGFVENFEDITFDLIQAETPNMDQDSSYKRFALGLRNDPIEEIALGRTENAGRFECCSREHTPTITRKVC